MAKKPVQQKIGPAERRYLKEALANLESEVEALLGGIGVLPRTKKRGTKKPKTQNHKPQQNPKEA